MELVNDVAHQPATSRGVVIEGTPCGPARADLCRHELRGRHLHGGCIEQGHGAFMQEAVADFANHRGLRPAPRQPAAAAPPDLGNTPVRVHGAELQQHGQDGQWPRAAAPSTGRSLRVRRNARPGPRDQPGCCCVAPGCWPRGRCVPGRRQQVLQHGRVHRRLIGGDSVDAMFVVPIARSKNRWGCLGGALWEDIDVDDLAELVDGPVDVAPLAGDLHARLVHLPAISHAMPAGPGGVGQQRREPQHPPVDGDVVDLDPTLGE